MTSEIPSESSTHQPGAVEILQPDLEAALKQRVGTRRSPLYDMLRYHMGWVADMSAGELPSPPPRVHGILCLLAANSIAGSFRTALPAAAGVELAQAFLAIQEDLRLGSPDHGDRRPALWWVWGHSQGINASDGMYSLARLALMDLARTGIPADRILQATALMDEACLEVCERQYAEIALAERGKLAVADYLRIAEGESGALMGAAAAIGALVMSAPEKAIKNLQVFGRQIGVAFRIRCDIDALWGREPSSGSARILEALDNKRSLPILRAMETCNDHDRHTIEALAARQQPIEDRHLTDLLDLLERSGARQFAESTVGEHLAQGLEALASAGVGRSGTPEMEQFARHLAGGAR